MRRRVKQGEASAATSPRMASRSRVGVRGYVCGMVGHLAAEARVGDLGKEMMKKAEDSGGVVGSAAKLGLTITGMKDNVTKLQENIGVLEEIQRALGG
jgi:hypothetical protein